MPPFYLQVPAIGKQILATDGLLELLLSNLRQRSTGDVNAMDAAALVRALFN